MLDVAADTRLALAAWLRAPRDRAGLGTAAHFSPYADYSVGSCSMRRAARLTACSTSYRLAPLSVACAAIAACTAADASRHAFHCASYSSCGESGDAGALLLGSPFEVDQFIRDVHGRSVGRAWGSTRPGARAEDRSGGVAGPQGPRLLQGLNRPPARSHRNRHAGSPAWSGPGRTRTRGPARRGQDPGPCPHWVKELACGFVGRGRCSAGAVSQDGHRARPCRS